MATEKSTKVNFLEVAQVTDTILGFKLADGQSLTFDAAECDESIQQRAMMHGFNQKIRDAAAGFSKEKDYEGAFEAMLAVIEALQAGEWNRKATATKGKGILAEAIARIKGVSVEAAQSAVAKANEDQVKAWQKNPKVASVMAEIVAERAKKRAADAADEIEIDLE